MRKTKLALRLSDRDFDDKEIIWIDKDGVTIRVHFRKKQKQIQIEVFGMNVNEIYSEGVKTEVISFGKKYTLRK